jgi:hypothetical protein
MQIVLLFRFILWSQASQISIFPLKVYSYPRFLAIPNNCLREVDSHGLRIHQKLCNECQRENSEKVFYICLNLGVASLRRTCIHVYMYTYMYTIPQIHHSLYKSSLYRTKFTPDASLSLDRLLYIAPPSICFALVLHLGIEKYYLPWHRVRESAMGTCQAGFVAQLQPDRQCTT